MPVLVGLKAVSGGLDIKAHPAITLNVSETPIEKLKRRIFLRTGSARGFLAKVKQQEAKLVHAHFAVDACAFLPIVRQLRIPLIVTLHGYDIMRHESSMHQWPETRTYIHRKRELWRDANLFLCVSEHIRKQALQQGFPKNKLRVHRIGVNLIQFVANHESRREKIVLFVGRLVEKKGCTHLIHAMSHVEKTIPGARLVVIGDGPLRLSLEREAAQSIKNSRFLGKQSHAEVCDWMARAAVLALPSIRAEDGDCEGLPTVACEAQAAGLPVAAFATGGVSEAFPEKIRSMLPNEGDEAGLAEIITRLLTDVETWRRFSISGRRYIEEHLDLELQTCALEHIYDDIVAAHK